MLVSTYKSAVRYSLENQHHLRENLKSRDKMWIKFYSKAVEQSR
jgi:hypothetical protein